MSTSKRTNNSGSRQNNKKWKSMMKYAGQDTNSDKVNEYIK